jgi:translation elongation factor EF-4
MVESSEGLTNLEHFRVSAKEGLGIEELFVKVIEALDHCA